MERPNTQERQSRTPTVWGKTLIPVKTLLEGALYLSARPLQVSDMAKLAGVPEKQVRKILQELQKEYEERLSAFTIATMPEDRFVLQLRHELTPLIEDLAPDGLLSEPVLRTLGWIAYKQPVSQATLVKERGSSGVYKHVQELQAKGFITVTPSKRTYVLETTPMFADYFGLSRDITDLKRQILQWMRQKTNFEQNSPKDGE